MATIYPPRTPAKTYNPSLDTSVPIPLHNARTKSPVNNTDAENRHGQELWEKEKRTVFETKNHQVAVLLISWEPGEHPQYMDTTAELNDMETVFTTKYNYIVETKLLSIKNPQQTPRYQLSAILLEFLTKYDRPGNLLFIYYGGHGTESQDGEELMLLSNPFERVSLSTALNWSDVEPVLYKLSADLILTFDCCYAGLVDRNKRIWKESRSHFQFIGSTSWDGTARGPTDPGSFTRALINAFNDLADEKEFTTGTLMRKALESKDFRDIPQHPLTTACGKDNSRRLVIRPMPNPQAAANQSTTSNAPTTDDDSLNFYLHFKYVFKETPSEEHIKALIDRLKDVVTNDRLPIIDVLWEGLSEYNPRMSFHNAVRILQTRLGHRHHRPTSTNTSSSSSSTSAGRLEISASTKKPPAMLQRTLTTLTMDDGKLISKSTPANDAERNTSVTDDSTSISKAPSFSSHIVTLPFFYHPLCKPGRFVSVFFFIITLAILATLGAILFMRFSHLPLLIWVWIVQRVQSG